MIFYSRKPKKVRVNQKEYQASLSLLLPANPHTSNSSLKNINIRLLSSSNDSGSRYNAMMRFGEKTKTSAQVQQLLLKRGTQSQLKKRGKREQEQMARQLISLDVTTATWCLYDSQTRRYLGFREDNKRQVASLTKIMTVLVSIEVLEQTELANTKVKITETAANMVGTSAFLKIGVWVSFKDLIYGAMLPSGNDAAYSLAEYVGYLLLKLNRDESITNFQNQYLDLTGQSTSLCLSQFLKKMNAKAKKMNLDATWFSNPHGLQNALNTSSAKDVIRLCRRAMNNSFFRKVVNTREHHYFWQTDKKQQNMFLSKWKNTNQLLHKGWEGVKTGFTQAAGGCLASSKEGIYIVVLNCQTELTRFTDTEKIFQWYKSMTKRPDPSVRSLAQLSGKCHCTITEGCS